MSDERRKPTWGLIVATLITLPVLYVASFGPACWLTAGRHGRMTPYHPVMMIYVPIGMIIGSDPLGEKWPSRFLQRWATLMARKDRAVNVPDRWNGLSFWSYLDRR